MEQPPRSPFATRRVPLGRTGLQVSPLGLGGAWLGLKGNAFDDDQAVATVLRALDLGLNLIDTSGSYSSGQSERRIGLALDEFRRRGGRREQLVLSTKTGTRTRPHDYSGDGTRRSIEASLAALRTDYLDVALVHDPQALEPVMAPGGALEVLHRLKSEGVIRAVGLGVRNHEFHRRLIEAGEIDVSLTYRDHNLVNQSIVQDLLPLAEARGIGVLNGMVLVGGLLAGGDPLKYASDPALHGATPRRGIYVPKDQETSRACAAWEFAQNRKVPLLALNLQFSLCERRIATTLLGASRPEEIEEDVRMALAPLPDGIWGAVEKDLGITRSS
jgi:aryl-alcohol dehydrogenase-like predicted oxidoreductase